MTGAELKRIRRRLGLSTTELGRAFGYEGSDITASGTIRKYESDARPIPPWLARLAYMFERHEVPTDFLDTRAIRLNALRAEIATSTNVPQLSQLLNEFEELRKDMASDFNVMPDVDVEPIAEVPIFDETCEIDFSDFGDDAISVDAEYILLRRQGGGEFFYMSRSDFEDE